MTYIFIVDRGGTERKIEARAGSSLLEIIKRSGNTEIAALCGGSCSCSTCHIYIDADFCDRLPGPGEEEDDLLDSTAYRALNSRLACQIEFGDSLDGLRLTIAPEG